jgi:hypothetical protein
MSVTSSEAAMNEGSYAWPFAVSRNAWLDWRPCVAPAHMIAQGGEYFLVHAADPGDRPCPSPVFERVISTERYGDLTVLARCLPATADLIGGSSHEQLRDRAGRPIQLIEGLILPGHQPGSAAGWEDQLARAHEIALHAFPEFWRSEDETAPPTPSQPLTRPLVDDVTADRQATDSEPGSAVQVGPQGRSGVSARRVIVSAVTVLVGLVLLYILIRVARR